MSGKKHKLHHRIMIVLGTSIATGWSAVSLAGGFQIPLQNVTNLGTAYAGTASLAEDASTGFWNAAGLTRLHGEQSVVGGIITIPSTKLHVSSATSTTNVPLAAGDVRPSNKAFIPSMHYSKKINDRWAFGLSAVTTFGSKTNYKADSVARYIATHSEMMAVNAGPSAAYRFDNGLSLGGGLDLLYVSTQSSSALETTHTLNSDGFTKSIVSRSGLGYHMGLLQEMSDATRLGAQYRSKIRIKAKGDSTTQQTASMPVTTQGTWSNIDFPEYVVLSAYHDLNDKWAVMSDLQLTHWSKFKTLAFNFDDGTTLTAPQNYKNNYRIAVGGIYQYDQQWRFKMGGSFEKRATQDIGRSIFIPDQDQIVPALGVQYRLNKRMAIDLAYAHVFYKKANIHQAGHMGGNPASAATIKGTMRHQINSIGAQLTWDL